ncbi:MAG: amidohydrolase family protein [Candidatus Binatia bacterium]
MIIDTHFHAFPAKYLETFPEAAEADPRGIGFHPFTYEEYIGHLDKYGIDIGVLSNPAGRIEVGFNRKRAFDLAVLCNNAYAEYSNRYPNRLKWFARVPMVHMDDAVAELHRCVKELGTHGVVMPTNIGAEKSLDDPDYKTFWAEAASSNVPVFLHPYNAVCHSRWNKYSLVHKVNWPVDTTLALSRLVLSGIFDRHPNLKLIGSHLGGLSLFYLDRMNWQEGNPDCIATPEDYFKKIYYDVAGPVRAPAIRFVCDTVGPDHVLFGTDYPHGRGGRDDQFCTLAFKAMEKLDISPEDKEKIFYKNAQRIFRF